MNSLNIRKDLLLSRAEWLGWCYWNFQVRFPAMVTKGCPRIANVIAVRVLSVAGEPGREIRILIGKPRPDPDPSVWRCSFLVEGIPKARRRVAYGVDSLQAMQNAVEGARRALRASGLVCTWHGGSPGEIGLPRAIPSYEGSGLAEKIELYIERELTKFLRHAKARGFPRTSQEG